MSYSEIKSDLLEAIQITQGICHHTGKVFIFNNKDIYDLYDGCESTKDASDALNSLWKYDGELARIEVSRIDKSLIADRESVPTKGYFYAMAQYAPPGFEMQEKFKLTKKEDITPEITAEPLELEPKPIGYYPGGMMHGGFETIPTSKKETEMDEAEKEYMIEVWEGELDRMETDLHVAIKDPENTLDIINSYDDIEEYLKEVRKGQDEILIRYRVAKKQLEALK